MFQWIRFLLMDDLRIINLEGKVAQMSVELEALKESVALVHKAVAEAVDEIHSLADRIADLSTRPNPEAGDIIALADDLRTTAETLHSAVYPPSSHVDLEP